MIGFRPARNQDILAFPKVQACSRLKSLLHPLATLRWNVYSVPGLIPRQNGADMRIEGDGDHAATVESDSLQKAVDMDVDTSPAPIDENRSSSEHEDLVAPMSQDQPQIQQQLESGPVKQPSLAKTLLLRRPLFYCMAGSSTGLPNTSKYSTPSLYAESTRVIVQAGI